MVLSDDRRAWTVAEIAYLAALSESAVSAELDEGEAGGVVRWVIFESVTLWIASSVDARSSLEDAYHEIATRTGRAFVGLAELAERASLTPAELHAELRKLEATKRARFSGTNLAILPESSRRFAFRLRSGERVALVELLPERVRYR